MKFSALKLMMMLMGSLPAFFSTGPAHGGLLYPDFPAAPTIAACAKPDFNSYHRARNAESMIRSANPALTGTDPLKPNFDGKYLLVRVPYMMGTDWLIVDCDSGKFLKEVLSDGEAEFRLDSSLILFKNKTETGWYRFTGSEFVKTEEGHESPKGPALGAAPAASSAPAKESGEVGVLAPYESYLKAFSPAETGEKCAPLQYGSYFRAQQAKSEILHSGASLSAPNFAGHYLMLRVELLFQTIWLVADCRTGKFIDDFLTGEAHFKKNSALFVMTESKKPPAVHLLSQDAFIRKPDPTLKEPAPVENKIFRDEARTLIAALPNPEHHRSVEVLNLRLIQKPDGTGFTCEAQSEGPRGKATPLSFSGEACTKILPLLERYGPLRSPDDPKSPVTIEFVRCSIEQESCLLRSRI